jgi:hypothetical protein
MEQKGNTWIDEKGQEIPLTKHITPYYRKSERNATRLFKGATDLNERLKKYKQLAIDLSKEVYELYQKENGILADQRKGNFTWYNFDKSVKCEIHIAPQFAYDKEILLECQEMINEYIDTELPDESFAKMLKTALKTTKDNLDKAKLDKLFAQISHIKDTNLQAKLKELKKSVKATHSKVYFNIHTKNKEGTYDLMVLNLSSINLTNK